MQENHFMRQAQSQEKSKQAKTRHFQPNILLIMGDSLAPHFISPYGDKAAETPNMARLSQSGITFEQAYCNSPLCAPSRASMVTGRYIADLGVFDNADSFASEWPTMGHVLSAAGYETVICGKMHFLGHDQLHGFDQRLAHETDYSWEYDPRLFRLAFQWQGPDGPNMQGNDWMGLSYVSNNKWKDYRHHYNHDETIHQEALAYLQNKDQQSKPFFCCVSYHAPHNPFWIPEQLRNMFRDRELPLPTVPEGVQTCHGIMDQWLNNFHDVPQVKEAMMCKKNLRWLYETFYGVVADLDRRIGEILCQLEKQGVLSNTAVIFTGDHGDMLGHRGMLQKRYFYERSTRVPLIFSWPGSWPENQRVSGLVSLIDLLPTFADLAQAPLPDGLPGKSLAPVLEGSGRIAKRTVFCEYHGEGVHAPCFMARKENLKYIYVDGHEERLYNTADDPGEYVNLASEPAYAIVLSEFRRELLLCFDPKAIARRALQSQHNRCFILKSRQRKH